MPPTIDQTDLFGATALMDRWEASLGDSDAVWACLEAIAHQGGFHGLETLQEAASGNVADVIQRPWRWWAAAAAAAHAEGDQVLPARIFLFTQLFKTQMVPNMSGGNMMSIGLDSPAPEYYSAIASVAVDSLRMLPPEQVVHQSATGRVSAASAIDLALEVATG